MGFTVSNDILKDLKLDMETDANKMRMMMML